MWVELGAGVVEECVDELHDFPFIILDKWSGATGNLSLEVTLVYKARKMRAFWKGGIMIGQ